MLVAESVATVLFLLHQQTLLTVIQVIMMVMMMMMMIVMMQDHLTTKLKTSFGVEEDFSSAVSYVQNKVRRAKLRSKHGLKRYKYAKLPQETR